MKVLPLGKKLTIAIDVDGTVADSLHMDYSEVDNNPDKLLEVKPIKGAVEAVKKFFEEGHKIVFYTSRNFSSKEITEKWLSQHGFPFHHVECEKFVAHIYIDDRAINGCDWARVMEDMKRADLPGVIARNEGRI